MAVIEPAALLGQPQNTINCHLAIPRHADRVATRCVSSLVQYRLADIQLAEVLTPAFSHAQHQQTVLLAPVGTSLDQIRDCAQRGDSFWRAGRALTDAAEVEA